MKSLSDKIEEIRRQPEHIRIKYVWGGVAVSMFFIVVIWFFSIASMIQSGKVQNDGDNIEELKAQLEDIGNQTSSIQEIGKQIMDSSSEGLKDQESVGNNDLESSTPEQDQAPRSSAYSKE